MDSVEEAFAPKQKRQRMEDYDYPKGREFFPG